MDLSLLSIPTPLTELTDDVTVSAGVKLYIKRDDLIHPLISGNKYRKLKYNLRDARSKGFKSLLTFGGAFSNHLYATAAAGNLLGFKTIGIVRGEDHEQSDTPTLAFCRAQEMEIHYVSRREYKLRNTTAYLKEIQEQYPGAYIIPEGGTTTLALEGVAELVNEVETQLGKLPDYFAVAAGTGGTAAGLSSAGARVLAFSALKGGAFLKNEITLLLKDTQVSTGSPELFTDYHFGGYARQTPELIHFIWDFKSRHDIQLEQVYTGKMFFGLYDLLKKGHFEMGTVIVAVHTGGLQGLLPELID